MTHDPLYQPLGEKPAAPAQRRWPWVGIALVGFAGLGFFASHRAHLARPGPRDVAVVPIEVAPKPAPAPPPSAAPVAPAPAAPSPPGAESVEIQNGVKIIRLAPAASSASVAVPVPQAVGEPLKPAPDPRLVEQSADGPLPRIGADGARPATVYARPLAGPPVPGRPRVAVLAADMGRDQMLTAQAARRWPPSVTFAFPADAPDLPTQVAEARAAGHEVVLQLPADALTGDAQAVRAMLGRATGYAGVSLPDGDPDQRRVVAAALAARGLFILDARPENKAGASAAGATAPDLLIPPAEAGTAAQGLAARARAQGSAIAVVPGPGLGADGFTALSDALAAQNVDLVPVSALADMAGRGGR